MMSPTSSCASDSDESFEFPGPVCSESLSSESIDMTKPSGSHQNVQRDHKTFACGNNEAETKNEKGDDNKTLYTGEAVSADTHAVSASLDRKSPTAVVTDLEKVDFTKKESMHKDSTSSKRRNNGDDCTPSRISNDSSECDASSSFRLSSSVMEEAKKKIQQAKADRERSILPKPVIPLLEMMLPHNRTLRDTEADFCRMFAPCATGSFYLNYNSSKSLSYNFDDSRNELSASSKNDINSSDQNITKARGGKSAEKSEVKSFVHCPRSAFNDVYGSDVSTDLMFEDAEGAISFDARKDIEITGIGESTSVNPMQLRDTPSTE